MTPSRSRNTASCSTSCVREEAVCAESGGFAPAEEALRGFEGDLERAFGLAGEAERGDGLVDDVGSGERLTGDLARPAAISRAATAGSFAVRAKSWGRGTVRVVSLKSISTDRIAVFRTSCGVETPAFYKMYCSGKLPSPAGGKAGRPGS